MPLIKLIADSGSTKTEWCLLGKRQKKTVLTAGISPYFLSTSQIIGLLNEQLTSQINPLTVDEIHYYGTGTKNPDNRTSLRKALKAVFPSAKVQVETDILGAARALCKKEKGIACILGTGSNSCYYNGSKIARNSPGLGYVLGDEGSGASLGKKVIQYYLYNTFDEELRARFDAKYVTTPQEILDNVYKKPLPNRYLASFALFLAENRGHYMIENIIEDGLNDFFFQHVCKYGESWKYPIHFVGSIAHGFQDVIRDMAASYGLETGSILQAPMDGLVAFHR
jgi:N-acetylglucosamine kinase-like BadF-type ATPase